MRASSWLFSAMMDFWREMARTLDANSHKGGWPELTPQECLTRIRIETRELAEAVKLNAPVEEVKAEAADIANFCLFLAHNYVQKGRRER